MYLRIAQYGLVILLIYSIIIIQATVLPHFPLLQKGVYLPVLLSIIFIQYNYPTLGSVLGVATAYVLDLESVFPFGTILLPVILSIIFSFFIRSSLFKQQAVHSAVLNAALATTLFCVAQLSLQYFFVSTELVPMVMYNLQDHILNYLVLIIAHSIVAMCISIGHTVLIKRIIRA